MPAEWFEKVERMLAEQAKPAAPARDETAPPTLDEFEAAIEKKGEARRAAIAAVAAYFAGKAVMLPDAELLDWAEGVLRG